MFSFLLACVVVVGKFCGEPPPSNFQSPHQPGDPGAHRRYLLELSRGRRAALETWNATFERHVADLSQNRIVSQRNRDRLIESIRKDIEERRVFIEFLRRDERELEAWEEEAARNPGPETDAKAMARIKAIWEEWSARNEAREASRIAPMPREVKR